MCMIVLGNCPCTKKRREDLVALDRNGWYVKMLMHHPMLFRSFWSFVKKVCMYGSWICLPSHERNYM